MEILVAFDKYKGAISADTACSVAAKAIQEKLPDAKVVQTPLTDGGEGFASVLATVLGGELQTRKVCGPLFREVEGKFALVSGEKIPDAAWKRLNLPEVLRNEPIGIIEMASASGYESLTDEERNPWETTTYGTGQLMKEAVQAGAKSLILGIGGSATNDCGAGALEALGVCYYDRILQSVENVTPSKFKLINTLGSTSHLIDSFPPVRIACDVTNPLLGENGATRVFGPQKGLKEEDADRMERAIRKMGSRILGLFGKNITEWEQYLSEPGSGAAGGIGFALRHAFPDSQFVEGFPLVADLLDLPNRIQKADAVVSGEGRLDETSLAGKGPVGIVRLSGPTQQVLLFPGSADQAVVAQLQKTHPGVKVTVLSDPDWPLHKALKETPDSLAKALREAF